MLKPIEIQRLENYARKLAGEDNDKIDIKQELIEKELSVYENKRIIKEKIRQLLGIKEQENESKKAKSDELMIQSQINNELRNEEEKAEEEFLKSLEEISKSKNTGYLEEKFFMIKQFSKMVGLEKAEALVIKGKQGIGKTFNCIKSLQEIKRNFVVITSFLTPLELYHLLYQYKEGYTLIFDDCSLFQNKYNQSILKSATFSPTGTRIIRYLSSTPKLKVPSSYIFKSTLIFCINQIPKLDEDFKAILDRCLFYNLELNKNEILKLMAELVKLPYKKLTEIERKGIFKFIQENSNLCDISLRTLAKLYAFYDFDKENWEKMALEILKPDEELKIVGELLEKYKCQEYPVKFACQEYIDLGHGSRADFYRKKKRLIN